MKKLLLLSCIALLLASLVGCSHKAETAADKIYINGTIITVDNANTTAEAVAVRDGKILAVGSNGAIEKFKGDSTEVIDLKGSTLVPGFIDGHSHFMSLGRHNTVNVAAPPVGKVLNIPDIVKELQQFQAEKKIAKGEWISAFGYDVDQLTEKRHLQKEDLDAAFPDNPVVVRHVSGHMSVANSLALRLSGITAATADPAGGKIVKGADNQPTGLLQETAARLLKVKRDSLTDDQKLELIRDQQLYYASHGITTAQDGHTSYESLQILKKAAAQKQLIIDLEILPSYHTLDDVLADSSNTFGELSDHLKLAGFKLTADGSPQGKTAFFSKPYLTEVPGCGHEHCTGFPNVTEEYFKDAIIKGFKNNVRTFVHCNGDATIDLYLKAIKNANEQLNTTSNDRRPVVIHSQFVRNDQLDDYKKLGIIPAFFSNHAFFWGDVHTNNLGKERADFLSPLKTAAAKGIIATNHTDYGVTPLSQLFLLWTSVARESRSGVVIGEGERLSVIEALRAITINGAYQYQEETIKGSIEQGKLADFVILSKDITKIPVAEIKAVEVLETIKEGKTVYRK